MAQPLQKLPGAAICVEADVVRWRPSFAHTETCLGLNCGSLLCSPHLKRQPRQASVNCHLSHGTGSGEPRPHTGPSSGDETRRPEKNARSLRAPLEVSLSVRKDEGMVFDIFQLTELSIVLVETQLESQILHSANEIGINDAPLPNIVDIAIGSPVLRMDGVEVLKVCLIRFLVREVWDIAEIFVSPQI